MRNLYEELNATGQRCDVLTYNTRRRSETHQEAHSTVYCAASWGALNSVRLSGMLPIQLKRLAPHYDIIHLHHPDPMSALAVFMVRPRAKIVLHWHSDIVRQKISKYLFLPLQRWLLNRADAVIVTSPNYKQSAHLSEWRAKVHVVPIGIAADALQANPARVAEIRKCYHDRFMVLALGRLVYYKGFEYLIQAAQYLDENCVVLIGGDGPYKNRLNKLIKKLGLSDKVFLLGAIDDSDLANYYQACNTFCLSSIARSEAFGIVQLEAMKFAKPVVATAVHGSGVAWVNADRVSGINVRPQDSRALAQAIAILQSQPTLAADFGKRGCRRFYESFIRAKMCVEIVKIYRNLIAL